MIHIITVDITSTSIQINNWDNCLETQLEGYMYIKDRKTNWHLCFISLFQKIFVKIYDSNQNLAVQIFISIKSNSLFPSSGEYWNIMNMMWNTSLSGVKKTKKKSIMIYERVFFCLWVNAVGRKLTFLRMNLFAGRTVQSNKHQKTNNIFRVPKTHCRNTRSMNYLDFKISGKEIT